jgi:hypothetical protein
VWVWHERRTQEYVYRTYTIFGGTLIRRFWMILANYH